MSDKEKWFPVTDREVVDFNDRLDGKRVRCRESGQIGTVDVSTRSVGGLCEAKVSVKAAWFNDENSATLASWDLDREAVDKIQEAAGQGYELEM